MKGIPHNIFMDSFYDVSFRCLQAPQITVYNKPKDFPDKYVARIYDALAEVPCDANIEAIKKHNPEWASKAKMCHRCNVEHLGPIVATTNFVVVKDTLDELRDAIPSWFARMERSPDDDPSIVEVWI